MKPESQAERQLIVATLGHVDHGKSRLVRALTGVDTDRLPDEKRRGISIELGYARLSDAPVSFIDVPGHKKLVHTMISGMGGVDVGLLVVAADDGVMPQTLEHLQVCRLSQIECVVVALTKADSVDEETLELAALDVESTLAELGVTATIIHTDALTGRGVDQLRHTLVGHQVTLSRQQRAVDERTWLAIDRVFSVRGSGKVVTGTLIRGALHEGTELQLIQPLASQRVTCRGLQVHDQRVASVRAPSRVAVNLSHLPQAAIERGHALAGSADETAVRRLDALVLALPSALDELKSGASVLCHIGSGYRSARLTWLQEPEAGADGATRGVLHGLAHLALESAIPAQSGVGLILRGFRQAKERGAVLGGGRVLDVAPGRLPRRREISPSGSGTRWAARVAALAALADTGADDQLRTAAERVLEAAAPRPLAESELRRRFGLLPDQLKRVSSAKGRSALLNLEPDLWTTKASVTLIEQELHALVEAHHQRAPHEPGLPSESALAELGRRSCRALAARCLNRALRNQSLLSVSGRLSTPSFRHQTAALTQQNRERVLSALRGAGLQGLRQSELEDALDDPNFAPEALRATLASLSQAQTARQLDGIWFHESALELLRAGVTEHFVSATTLSISDLKQRFGVSRKQAVPLLEQLDREGITRRAGSQRLRGNAP